MCRGIAVRVGVPTPSFVSRNDERTSSISTGMCGSSSSGLPDINADSSFAESVLLHEALGRHDCFWLEGLLVIASSDGPGRG